MTGIVSLPGSKSLTNRALVLAALAERPSVVRRPLRSRDTLLMAAGLAAMGVGVRDDGDDWRITPAALTRDAEVDCGLAGTVMRFVPPVAGLSVGTVAFDGDPHMRRRPVGEVLAALDSLGMTIDDGGRGALPFVVRGTGSVARRHRGDRRQRLVAVHLRAAAGGRTLRQPASTSATTASRCRHCPTSR